MQRRKLQRQLYPSYLLITFLSLLAVTWFAWSSFQDFYRKQVASNLGETARLLRPRITDLLEAGARGELDALVKDLGRGSDTRITVIAPDGKVLADSDEDPAVMRDHSNRPEIIQALRGEIGESVRPSPTLRKNMMYVAVPVERGGKIVAVLRTSIPLVVVTEILDFVLVKILAGVLFVVLLAAFSSWLVSRRISRPLEEMKLGAERFAAGDLSHALPVPESEEMAELATAMNRMAADLNDKIATISERRNELEALLSSMVEGVLAIDPEETIISLNQAAGELLGIDPGRSVGKHLHEVVRNTDLQRFAAAALAGDETVEGEIVVRNTEEHYLQAHGTSLRDSQGKDIGAVLVLNDVTRIRRLENVRRDFVANVSHELRTPITSIKGFVETLLDGAMDDPKDARRFLEIMAKQAERLNAIIEDLLALSKIEQETEQATIEKQSGSMSSVLRAAIQACRAKTEGKDIRIDLVCPDDMRAEMNARLIEQAVVNLLDNAVKYSEPGSAVQVEAIQKDRETIVEVRDHGCGIEREHIPRLFERFYRVDKARSRQLGGTGLGLAIVKHIAQAHGGHVTVDSAPGQGSVFSIRLPNRS